MLAANTQNIWAYDYQMTGACQDGKVTITALGAGQNINGYSTLSGYRVDYELTENFIAFSKYDGCDFYVGNNLNPSGGCHFAYKPNGEIWQQGALNLGAIYDGRSVGSAEPDANNTVRASFQVGSLAELRSISVIPISLRVVHIFISPNLMVTIITSGIIKI